MRSLVAAAALVALGTPGLQAHHGLATFEADKMVTIEGTVTGFEWTNPHVFVYVDVADGQGAGNWRIEFPSIGNMRVRGFTRTFFKPGDKVRVTGSPRRDGFKELFFRQGSFANGAEFPGQPGQTQQTPATNR
jgi:hypothetical protein